MKFFIVSLIVVLNFAISGCATNDVQNYPDQAKSEQPKQDTKEEKKQRNCQPKRVGSRIGGRC